MTQLSIPTTPIPPALDAARRALAALTSTALVADTDLTDDDLADDVELAAEVDRLAAVEALAVLSDVRPPYPPLPDPIDPIDPIDTSNPGGPLDTGTVLAQVLDHLEAAIDEATSIQELTRIAAAALVLRHRGGVAG